MSKIFLIVLIITMNHSGEWDAKHQFINTEYQTLQGCKHESRLDYAKPINDKLNASDAVAWYAVSGTCMNSEVVDKQKKSAKEKIKT